MNLEVMCDQVALVQMPFAQPQRPSLGLSLLKAALRTREINGRIYYANIWFAEMVGWSAYESIASCKPSVVSLAGEWIFSEAVWGSDPQRDDAYVREVLMCGSPFHRDPATPEQMDDINTCRAQVEPFLQRCLEQIPWQTYRVVGFTSMFQQQLASLALAQRLKSAYPHLFLVMGGANCEGPMGAALFHHAPFLDAICTGEGDLVFPLLVERVLAGQPIGDLPGILHRQEAVSAGEPMMEPPVHVMVTNLDALPYPDFDDFFAAHSAFRPAQQRQDEGEWVPELTFETSRGCWWGQKSHCTFCGLNGANMTFRHKSAQRAFDELRTLLERYGHHTRRVSASDNIIPHEYFQTLLPMLRESDLQAEIFYETKANLRKEQVALYRAAGLREIQPGIESLSTSILKRMGKGVTALQNVQLLKWCRQFDLFPHWNFLVGFPGELPEHYADIPDLIASIAHLHPPTTIGAVRFDRFSPYFVYPDRYGLREMQPYPAYRYIYPAFAQEELQDIAYYFTARFDEEGGMRTHLSPLVSAITDWQQHQDRYALFSVPLHDRLFIGDFRPGTIENLVVVSGAQRALLDACESISTRSTLQQKLTAQLGKVVEGADLERLLRSLIVQRLLLAEGDSYLALAIPLGERYAPREPVIQRFQELLLMLKSHQSGEGHACSS